MSSRAPYRIQNPSEPQNTPQNTPRTPSRNQNTKKKAKNIQKSGAFVIFSYFCCILVSGRGFGVYFGVYFGLQRGFAFCRGGRSNSQRTNSNQWNRDARQTLQRTFFCVFRRKHKEEMGDREWGAQMMMMWQPNRVRGLRSRCPLHRGPFSR